MSDVIRLSDGRVNRPILNSNELVTEFTINAERRTEQLSGVSIDTDLSVRTKNLRSISSSENDRAVFQMVHRINERSIHLLNSLIDFKECILKEVKNGK